MIFVAYADNDDNHADHHMILIMMMRTNRRRRRTVILMKMAMVLAWGWYPRLCCDLQRIASCSIHAIGGLMFLPLVSPGFKKSCLSLYTLHTMVYE